MTRGLPDLMAAAESHARAKQEATGTVDDSKAGGKTNGSDSAAAHQLHTVTWYLMDDGRYNKIKPFFSNIPFEHPDARQTNIECEPHDIVVTDIHGHEDELSLDVQGFQVLKTDLQLDYEKFADNQWIKEKHYPLVERWLREVLGENVVERIYIYDHTVRRHNKEAPVATRGTEGALQPVPAAHVDHSAASGPTRVRAHLDDDEAEKLMKHRYQIINVWHPLFGPVEDWPLAFCDARSVDPHNFVPCDLLYPHYFGEIYSLTYNKDQKWYYLKDQMPHEVVFVKCFDSKNAGQARFTPHCGVDNPEAGPDARPRESIEFRTMVFYNEGISVV